MKNKIKLLLQFSINSRSFAPVFHTMFAASFSYILSFAGRAVVDTVLLFQIKKPPPPTLKEGKKAKKKEHIQVISSSFLNFAPNMVGGEEEHFAILEALEGLFWHFLQHSLHVPA